jgi:hypothetical protein
MKINLPKWTQMRLEVESTIREAKSRKYESGQSRWRHGPDDWALAKHKGQATWIYQLRASLRGRVELDPAYKEKLLVWAKGLELVSEDHPLLGTHEPRIVDVG